MKPPKIPELKKITIEPTFKRIKSEGTKAKKVMTKHEAVHTMLDEIRKLESEKLALQNEVKELKEKVWPEWISVKDRLPETCSRFLVSDNDAVDIISFDYSAKEWFIIHEGRRINCNSFVKFWMPLPKLPKS